MPFLQLKEHDHQTEGKFEPLELIKKLKDRAFHSENVGTQAASYSAHVHPTRTLFQYLNPRNNSRRDLKQVVCRMLGPRDGRFLYVSQVWILVVNEGGLDFDTRHG